MKIVLVHCYSDYNRGDLGILLATIRLLREEAEGCRIEAISTFDQDDPKFATDHLILRQHVDKLHGAIIGRAYSNGGSILGLIWKLVREVPMLIFCLSGFVKLLRASHRNGRAHEGIEAILSADCVVSKGGSFLCNQASLVGQMRFLRLASVLSLAVHSGVPSYIWGQSVGPVYGFVPVKVMNFLLEKCAKVILREDECVRRYSNLSWPVELRIGHDLAFSLRPVSDQSLLRKKDCRWIGITIKRLGDPTLDQKYGEVIHRVFDKLLKTSDLRIVVIPHVTIDDDMVRAAEIVNTYDGEGSAKIEVVQDDLTPAQLLSLYGELFGLVGTRLHSTIFACVVGTPVINISYHGTKSEGVFGSLGIPDWVIDGRNIDFERLEDRIEVLLDGRFPADIVKKNIQKIVESNRLFAREIVSDVQA